MYDALMEREAQQNRASQINDVNFARNNYNNNYSDRVAYTNVQPMQNFTPYAAQYNVQNDVYTQPHSDNINMNVSAAQMARTVQSANVYQQAPVYQPSYYDNTAYNNVRVNAQTYPTSYYYNQPAQANQMNQVNYAYDYNQQVMAPTYGEYETTTPSKQKGKIKNKMTKMLIAVYFLIIAVCAALILINVIAAAGTSTVDASATAVEPQASSISQIVNDDGSVSELKKTENVIDYKYDTETNWFDKLCDSLSKKIG